MDGSFLRVEEQRGHVVIGSVGTEELTDGRVDVFAAPHLQRSKVTHTETSTKRASSSSRTLAGGLRVLAVEGGRSWHSPRSMEAAKITTVVTMVTSKLSRTLKKAVSWDFRTERTCGWCGRRRGSPDELGFRVDVPHTVLGQGLVHAVEERPQKTPHHPHHDEEGQVHGGPQVTALISVWTLSEQTSERRSYLLPPPRRAGVGVGVREEGRGGTLNSPKLSRPGSWKEPHLLKLIPDRKKLRVKAADMEEKSCRGEREASVQVGSRRSRTSHGEDHQTSQEPSLAFDLIPLPPLCSASLHFPEPFYAEEPSACLQMFSLHS